MFINSEFDSSDEVSENNQAGPSSIRDSFFEDAFLRAAENVRTMPEQRLTDGEACALALGVLGGGGIAYKIGKLVGQISTRADANGGKPECVDKVLLRRADDPFPLDVPVTKMVSKAELAVDFVVVNEFYAGVEKSRRPSPVFAFDYVEDKKTGVVYTCDRVLGFPLSLAEALEWTKSKFEQEYVQTWKFNHPGEPLPNVPDKVTIKSTAGTLVYAAKVDKILVQQAEKSLRENYEAIRIKANATIAASPVSTKEVSSATDKSPQTPAEAPVSDGKLRVGSRISTLRQDSTTELWTVIAIDKDRDIVFMHNGQNTWEYPKRDPFNLRPAQVHVKQAELDDAKQWKQMLGEDGRRYYLNQNGGVYGFISSRQGQVVLGIEYGFRWSTIAAVSPWIGTEWQGSSKNNPEKSISPHVQTAVELPLLKVNQPESDPSKDSPEKPLTRELATFNARDQAWQLFRQKFVETWKIQYPGEPLPNISDLRIERVMKLTAVEVQLQLREGPGTVFIRDAESGFRENYKELADDINVNENLAAASTKAGPNQTLLKSPIQPPNNNQLEVKPVTGSDLTIVNLDAPAKVPTSKEEMLKFLDEKISCLEASKAQANPQERLAIETCTKRFKDIRERVSNRPWSEVPPEVTAKITSGLNKAGRAGGAVIIMGVLVEHFLQRDVLEK